MLFSCDYLIHIFLILFVYLINKYKICKIKIIADSYFKELKHIIKSLLFKKYFKIRL